MDVKAYTMVNTRLRMDAKNEFEKDFFRLMNNSVFGKTMENIRNHKDMKLVTSDKKYLKYVMKPNFKGGHPFSKHLFAVEMGKTEITMNKPVYLGQVILVQLALLSQVLIQRCIILLTDFSSN